MSLIRSPGASRRPLPLAPVTLLRFFVASLCAAPFAALAPVAANAADEDVQVRVETSLGDIVLALDSRRAPGTVDNFLEYVEDGYYDGTIFHRVIEGFMIQGGGFTPDFSKKATRAPIRNEADNGLSNRRHTIAMARTNAPHSATAQFFINGADNVNLDHTGATTRGWGYAVFGRVVEGQDVVESISRVRTGAGGPFRGDAPREPVVIVAAERIESDDAGEPADASPPLPVNEAGADGSEPVPASALPADGEITGAVEPGDPDGTLADPG